MAPARERSCGSLFYVLFRMWRSNHRQRLSSSCAGKAYQMIFRGGPRKDEWGMPGGLLDRGESIS